MLGFNLEEPIENDFIRVEPSKNYRFPNSFFRAGFVSRVSFSGVFGPFFPPYHYSTAVAAILTFAFEQPVRSPRTDDYDKADLSDDELRSLAIQHPIMQTASEFDPSPGKIERATAECTELFLLLHRLGYRKYLMLIRAIRLFQLAHLYKRDDFALGYFLLVSALESIAQEAVKRSEVEVARPEEELWEARSNVDPVVKELWSEYKRLRGQDRKLGLRFAEFTLRYCPVEQWKQLTFRSDEDLERIRREGPSWAMRERTPRFNDADPESLPPEEIRKILKDAYDYRSGFTHRGESPPYTDLDADRYFEIQQMWVKPKTEDLERQFGKETLKHIDGKTRSLLEQAPVQKRVLLPTFRLVSFLAKRSILNYYRDRHSRPVEASQVVRN